MSSKPLSITPNEQLVLPNPGQSAALFDLINNSREVLAPWLDWVGSIQKSQDVRQFLFDAKRFNEGGQRCTYVVQQSQALAGLVSLVRIDWPHHRAELGFWLGLPFQGQGLGTRACQRLLAYAFDDLCLNRIALRMDAANDRSVAMAKRLGFAFEGRLRQALRQGRSYQDLLLYSLLRQEWKGIQF